MPSPKQTKHAKPELSEERIREIETRNLNAMWLYYRRLNGVGQDVGHYVMMEIVLGNVLEAKRLAAVGKVWIPPDMTPEAYEAQFITAK